MTTVNRTRAGAHQQATQPTTQPAQRQTTAQAPASSARGWHAGGAGPVSLSQAEKANLGALVATAQADVDQVTGYQEELERAREELAELTNGATLSTRVARAVGGVPLGGLVAPKGERDATRIERLRALIEAVEREEPPSRYRAEASVRALLNEVNRVAPQQLRATAQSRADKNVVLAAFTVASELSQ